MVKGILFVVIYSIVLVALFAVFSYLMTTIDPRKNPLTENAITVTSSPHTPPNTLPPEPSAETDSPKHTHPDDLPKFSEHKYAHSHTPTKHKIPLKILEHRRKQDITEMTVVSQSMLASTKYDALPVRMTTVTADMYTETTKEPVQHDLSELGDKIKRILPPVHPAVKGFRRSVDDFSYGLPKKNVISLKIVDYEGVPRIEIKLRASNDSLRQQRSSKLNDRGTGNQPYNFYIQIDNEAVFNMLPVGQSRSRNYVENEYQSSENSVSVLNENDYPHNEGKLNTNVSPLDEFITFTSDNEVRTSQQESNTDFTGFINNRTKFANKNIVNFENDAIETVTLSTFHNHNNLTQNDDTNVTSTLPKVRYKDRLLEKVDNYRKIYSHSFYQRDKSEPNVGEDASQVTSDILVHFLPLVMPHGFTHSVEIKSVLNGSDNEKLKSKFAGYKNLLNNSRTIYKNITDSSINDKLRSPNSYYEENNNITINHPQIDSTTEKNYITSHFGNIMRKSSITADAVDNTFFTTNHNKASIRLYTPNILSINVTAPITNLHDPKNLTYSHEINYNTSTPRNKEEENVDSTEPTIIGIIKSNKLSSISNYYKKNHLESVAVTMTIKWRNENLKNTLNNSISTTSVPSSVNGTTLKTNKTDTSWLKHTSNENKTSRKYEKRYFYETTAMEPVKTISLLNTILHNDLSTTEFSDTEIYPIL